jgi:menaquinone-dependent protoporphyrinogen IX oxidase
MKTITIIGIGIILAVVLIFGAVKFVSYDMNSRATLSEALQPNGVVVGNALVVYDPSITGNTKNVAGTIAGDLQAKGYKVDLAGVKSVKASNASKYDIIVVGGPIYAGNASAAVKAYLEILKPAEGTKIGVFATGDPRTTDSVLIKKQIAPIPENSTFQITAVMNVISGDDVNKKCSEFVNDLLQ